MTLLKPFIYLSGLGLTFLSAGCASGNSGSSIPAKAPTPLSAGNASVRRSPVLPDPVALYRRMGLLAEGGETPFVGSLAFFAGPPDSTTVLLTVALSNRSLTFSREGDRYRASYNVTFEVRRGTEVVREFKTNETVRVLAFRETTRTDESVLFRQVISLVAGTYEVRLTVRDDNVQRGSAIEATVGVPKFRDGSLSSPVAFYEAVIRQAPETVPHIVATPRTTVVFGRDSTVPFYVEGYGTGSDLPVHVSVRADGASTVLWSDDVTLPRRSGLFAGTFNVPVGKLGVGVMTVGVSRSGATDTLRAPLFVGFGEDLPVATFTDMLEYLRYYVAAYRLQAMREATPDMRATLWASFLKDTDPVPQTPQHEGLRDYFGRIAQANARFREEGIPGWMTDRGHVLTALGTPDQIYEPNVADFNQRGRTQVWEYRSLRLQLVFVDQTGFGRWKMTMSSETEFEAAAHRVLVG